ncbi:hypothetical protein GCM10023169_32890 [Georgenia halophila]|uniref:ABC-2 type transport system permease protein n=1 Tax=Georgenia halophila TaxID=620889 RepID=A0ABP8LHV8_9MICO
MSAPRGRDVRRWTRRRTRLRDPASPSDLLYDLYSGMLAVAISASMVLAASDRIGTDLATGPSTVGSGLGLHVTWLAVLAVLACIAAVTGLAARLGPVALSPAQTAWWLPLPVDRRGLLRPAAVLWPLAAAALGTILGTAVSLIVSAPLVSGAAAGAGLTTSCVLAVGLTQVSPVAHRRARLTADVALAALPVLTLVLVVLDPPVPAMPDTAMTATAVLVMVLAAALGIALDRRLGSLADSGLHERGAVAGEALGAAMSADTRALGRALSAATSPPERARTARMRWLRAVPRRLAPQAAVVTSDALLLLRSRRHLVQLVVAACLPALALSVAQPVPFVTLILLVVGAYTAALAVTEGARRAENAPMLDALLPLGAQQVRLLRLLVPSMAHAGWSVVVFAVLAWRYTGPEWLVLGMVAAPVWAAGAVRAAYREPPDFSGGLIHTPMGAVPPGAAAAFSKGPDIAILFSAPSLVAVLIGTVSPVLIGVQAGLAVVALAIAGYASRASRPSASASSS